MFCNISQKKAPFAAVDGFVTVHSLFWRND